MAAGLNEYLRSARERQFIWGTFDCCIFAANWVEMQTGRDPMADLRGSYRTEAEADAIIAANGGLHGLLDARMERSNDALVGILTAPGQRPAMAIKAGRGWAVLTPEALAIVRAGVIGATVTGFA